MHLEEGRVEQMVKDATAKNGCIPCHKTLEGDHAVCRGFFESHPTQLLQVASKIGIIQWQDP